MKASGDESQSCKLQMAAWPWPYHFGGVAQGYIGVCCRLSSPPTAVHLLPTSLLDGYQPAGDASNLALVTRLRGKLRYYSTMPCPRIVVPATKTEKRDIDIVIDWDRCHLRPSQAQCHPHFPSLSLYRGQEALAQVQVRESLLHQRTARVRWNRNCLPLPFKVQGPL